MATSFSSFRTTPILSSASSNHRKPDPNNRKSSSPNWWTPLFGWSSDPDYINNETVQHVSKLPDTETGRVRSKFGKGCFTEEKAKELRRRTVETSSFHDIMYHSAVASRLAFDVSDP